MEWKLDPTAIDPGFWEEVVVSVGRGTAFYEGEGTSVFESTDGQGSLTVEFHVGETGVTIHELTVWHPDVSGETLRSISFPELKSQIIRKLEEERPIKRREQDSKSLGDYIDAFKEEWPSGAHLERYLWIVPHIYNRAVDSESPATQAVAKAMGVSRATAGRMVAKARETGLNLREPAPYPGTRGKGKNNGEDTPPTR